MCYDSKAHAIHKRIIVYIIKFQTHFCVPETREFQKESDYTNLCATIECEQPIPDLYKFIGRITVYNNSDSCLKSLGPENVLLRGARLKNTPYIYGIGISRFNCMGIFCIQKV